jgi:hypothetical protein
MDFKRACDSIRREVPMKLVRLITLCSYETRSKVRIDKYFSDTFLIQSILKQVDVLSPLLFIIALDYGIRKKSRKTRWDCN